MEATPDPKSIASIQAVNVAVGGRQTIIMDGQRIDVPRRDDLLAYAAAVQKAYDRWANTTDEQWPAEQPTTFGDGGVFIGVAAKPLPMRVSAVRTRPSDKDEPSVELLAAVQGAQRTIILGEPGSGKTTALERLAWVTATAAWLTGPDEMLTLPLMVRLASYHEAQPSLIPLLCSSYNKYSVAKLGEASMQLLLWAKNVRVVLLLDGLNEFRREAASSGRNALRILLDNNPDLVIHLTCRTADFDMTAQAHTETQVLPGAHLWMVQPLTDSIRYWDDDKGKSDVRTYLRLHLGEARGKQLYARLRGDERLHSLAQLPLFLWMFKESASSDEISANRGELLRSFVGAPRLLGRIDDKELRIRAERSLEAVAWRMASEGELETGEEKLYADLKAARKLREYSLDEMRDLLLRTGLLVHLDDGRYRLLHQIVQEYGAAAYAVRLPECGQRLKEFARSEWWREICNIMLWLHQDLQTPNYLLEVMRDHQVDVRVRVTAAEVLAKVGDPRFVRRTYTDGVQAIEPAMVAIPAGTAVLGGKDAEADDNELPQCEVPVGAFELSVYPVTNAEYACFMEADGYEDQTLWTESGQAWLRGDGKLDPETEQDMRRFYRSFSRDVEAWLAETKLTLAIDDADADNYRYIAAKWTEDDYVAAYANHVLGKQRVEPHHWQDGRFNGGNQPVVGINWYEAMAYAAWLSRATGKFYRLPTEAEWEWAARRSTRRYPWGDEWDPTRCNWRGSVLNRPNPVGIYFDGSTSDGLQELAGNVYEWTLSLYRAYRYVSSDGREKTDVEGLRVLRGGSWFTDRNTVRCMCRYWGIPWTWFNRTGFRLTRFLSTYP